MYDKKHVVKHLHQHKAAEAINLELEHKVTASEPSVTEKMQHKDELRAQKLLYSALQRQLRIAS